MKAGVVISALTLMINLAAAVSAATPGAEDVVRSTSGQVIERLAQEKQNLDAHPERLYELIQELVVPHFDFPIMSRWVLGKAWNTIDAGSQEQFTVQFRTLLVRTYAKALMEYSDEKVEFLPMESDPNSNLVVIKTQVTGKGSANPTPINYRMHVSGGEWKVIDISVDGVSLIGTYRGSFAAEIRKSGIDSLIQKLTERNERLLEVSGQSL
ncbi:MAG: hypothetical protein A3I78_00170 [Gammaproteobacteria bacterium RIFCSPLOWO2_02_FULL_56_15]|nr:MAG: hypothetical protein A3I78_00170 [Gammaproteobacteria bacterium RIFCSPLOWO2_02_FULL_56_15]